MIRLFPRWFLSLAGIGLLAASAGHAQMICVVDDEGKTHCGDSVPPELSRFDRVILNEQGVTIRVEQGEITPEERLAIDEARAAEEQRRQQEALRLQRDRMLLDTFLAETDIINLRDRRLELINGSITVYELFLRNLRRELEDLNEISKRFAPLNEREDATPLPANIQLDIDRKRSSIKLWEERLDESRRNQEAIKEDFQDDIDRFRELKGTSA